MQGVFTDSSRSIWDYAGLGYYVGVPTNIGFRSDGCNVMGRGLAFDAAQRFPKLAMMYGRWCREYAQGEHDEKQVAVYHRPYGLVMCPSKPLNPLAPWTSWKFPATVECVSRTLHDLRRLIEETGIKVAIPLLGAGNGGLNPREVFDLTKTIMLGLNGHLYVVDPKLREAR